jgi:hypothetical protein
MIHITKEGFKHIEWNGNIKEYVEEDFDSIFCLRDGVTLVENGVTLGNIITFTYRDEFLRGFIGGYSSCDVKAFYDELQLGVDTENDLAYITAAMNVEITESTKHKINRTLNISMDLYGRKDDDNQHWGLDLCAMREIGGVPFRLENNAYITELREDDYKHEDGLEYTPSLLEVLDCIFFDISFHGSPADKAGVALDLQRMVKEILNEKEIIQ